jgi:AraC-like DNA-binding protein
MPMMVGQNFVSQLYATELAFEEHEGPLGIKCCFHGEETYTVAGRRCTVDETSYLVLNHGQRYSSAMRGAQRVESFCLWFRPSFAEQVLSGLCTPFDRLLDDPRQISRQPVHFFERVYPHDESISPLLFRIRHAVNSGKATIPWLEEQFHLALERLLQSHRNVFREVERLPAARMATRLELYRRLYMAREFLDASVEQPVLLSEAADVACLSPHHFLRQFKQLFRETPHQYHRRKRLERAQRLLAETELSVTEICFRLGFESIGSFSWLFSRQFGLSPTRFRAEFASRRCIRLLSSEPDANGHLSSTARTTSMSP